MTGGVGNLSDYSIKKRVVQSLLASINSRADGVDLDAVLFPEALIPALLVARRLDAYCRGEFASAVK